ncbi:flagellar hook protein FlgE [Alkalimonas collagenimarina]|uniref:Flagellar hook protein FlgE n=1 Tax=Alkalimonas collagenimarina TaxID=400390 RepID=A0ABT9GXU7_9GAMM|nr:flagellar hook protein FlgE [Alkalimonas collagenimarina]MDP4535878.1 flagellar hook protein FlgE [Alkalimonas collagenimarina]
MSFTIALSGLAAAQKDLDVTANNIANVNTTGFKESRAEFADVYATSIFASGRTKVGDGVTTSVVAQQFNQGSLSFTNNSLDLAITGEGFFATTPDRTARDMTYTRAGNFKLDKDNFIIDNRGNFLQGFSVDPSTGQNQSVSLSTTQPISIPTTAGAPRATNNIFVTANLNSSEIAIAAPFDATDPATYSHSTSVTVYDSLGESHIVSMYFAKTAVTGEWDVYAVWDDVTAAPFGPQTLQFDSSGELVIPGPPPAPPVLTLPAADLNDPLNGYLTNGAEFINDMVINFRDPSGVRTPTQYAAPFDVTNLSQDGTTVGNLTGVDIDAFGRVLASYSNGDEEYLAQVTLVQFANVQGLKQVGNTSWQQTITSGEPIAGQANVGTFGAINSSALEQSNVNLTTELVDLISAQRNFQANSRALEVNSTLQQTILQIR